MSFLANHPDPLPEIFWFLQPALLTCLWLSDLTGPKNTSSGIVSIFFILFFLYVMHLNCHHRVSRRGCTELQLALLNRLILIPLNGNLFAANTARTVAAHAAQTRGKMCAYKAGRQASPRATPARRHKHSHTHTRCVMKEA